MLWCGLMIIAWRMRCFDKHQFTPIIMCNKVPSIPDADDEAIWRRMSVVPFKVKFKSNPNPSNMYEKQIDTRMKEKVLEWTNTNILLQEEGFTGLKTGWTYAANACLAATYKNKTNNKTLLAIVFNSPNKKSRFDDCRQLLHWANNKLYNEDKTEETVNKSKISDKPNAK